MLTRERDGATLGWLAAADPAALPGLARKLPHYGKYGYLVFTGAAPDNRLKGQWPPGDSPLVHWFGAARPPLPPAPRASLAEVADSPQASACRQKANGNTRTEFSSGFWRHDQRRQLRERDGLSAVPEWIAFLPGINHITLANAKVIAGDGESLVQTGRRGAFDLDGEVGLAAEFKEQVDFGAVPRSGKK